MSFTEAFGKIHIIFYTTIGMYYVGRVIYRGLTETSERKLLKLKEIQ